MKKTIYFVIFAVVLLFVVTAYQAHGKRSNTVKVGAILGLTGSQAYYSEEALKGIRLAQKDIETDKSFGSKIELIVEDTGGKSDKAANSAIKLIDQDRVSNLITFSGASAALSVAPIANSKKIVQMELICYAPKCHTKDDFLFRVSGGANVEPEFIADTLINKSIKNVYVIYANNDFGNSMSTFFSNKFSSQKGNSVMSDSFKQDESDFRTQIAKINSTKDIEYVVFIGFSEIKNFLKQSKELNMNLPVFAAQTAENPEVLAVAGAEGVKNLKYSYPGKTERKSYVDFKNRYIAEYKKEPSYAAFKGYDALMVLYKAMSKCAVLDSFCTKKELESVQKYEGASNVISFDEYGDIGDEVFHIKDYSQDIF